MVSGDQELLQDYLFERKDIFNHALIRKIDLLFHKNEE